MERVDEYIGNHTHFIVIFQDVGESTSMEEEEFSAAVIISIVIGIIIFIIAIIVLVLFFCKEKGKISINI